MDLRIRRTRKMLREALWDAIMEKGAEGLTVSEVCERAMINRATFYRHYEDINDLLLRGLDELFDEINALGEPAYPAEKLEKYKLTGPPRNFLLFIDFFMDRADFFQFMLSDRGVPAFSVRLRQYLEDMILERIERGLRDDHPPVIPPKIVAVGWAGQLMGILIWWLEHGRTLPAGDLAVYLTNITYHNIYDCLNMPSPEIDFDLNKALRDARDRFPGAAQ